MNVNRQKKQPFLLTLSALLLTSILSVSCMSARQLPHDHYYRLPLPASLPYDAPVFPGIAGVKQIKTDGIMNDRSLLYVDTRHPLEIKRSSYNYWQEAPAVLLQKHLAAFLSRAGAAQQILLYEPGMQADTTFSGHLWRFEREIGEKKAAVYVVLELSVTSSPINTFTRTYSRRITCRDFSIEAAVEALGTALVNIYGEFLKDMEYSDGKQAEKVWGK